MKTRSKVKSVQANGTWEGKDGTLYYRFDYVMEDGTAIQASHKTQQSFNAGEDVDYEVKRTHETYGKSGTVGKPSDFQQNQPGGGKKGSNASFALSYAKDLFMGDEITDEKVDKILGIADKFNEWLNTH